MHEDRSFKQEMSHNHLCIGSDYVGSNTHKFTLLVSLQGGSDLFDSFELLCQKKKMDAIKRKNNFLASIHSLIHSLKHT